MPVGSIFDAKEQASSFQPLLLADVILHDGTVQYYSTHAVTYGGHEYDPRILNKDIATTQALSEQGIDVPASVTLRLDDADFYLLSNVERVKGFKGSTLILTSVLYNAVTNEFSSNSIVIFRGVCKEPGGRLPAHDGKVLLLGYYSRLGMSDISLPIIRIQPTCPWNFPATADERQAAADDSKSDYYPCGYSPDATGSNARGNLNGGSPFTSCEYTKAACVARGMYTKDSSDRVTGTFGGIQWNKPQASVVREYVSGKWSEVKGGANEARTGDVVPMLWGTAWTDPLILNTQPDGNYLKMEALICHGEVDYIHGVVVNDVWIPHTYNDSSFTEVPPGVKDQTEALKGGWWATVNKGDRYGAPNADAGYVDESGVPQGDPYGSLAVIEIVVPRKVADMGSIPRVRVLTSAGTNNPSLQMKDILLNWAGWPESDLNTASFDTEANFDDDEISYKDMHDVTTTHERYRSSLYLRQKETIAEIIRGLRNNKSGILGPDSTGKLKLRTKKTLASQQPSAVTGSNYNTAVASVLVDGTSANGYVAYKFDQSNMLDMPQMSMLSAGNKFTLQFQNSENAHAWDSYSPLDSEDIRRVGQEIPGSFAVKGVDNYDQAMRLMARYFAEQCRGNWRGDTGGTLAFEFTLSYRGIHLNIGDICMFTWQPFGIEDQLVRVLRIAPNSNYETVKITATWHEDQWYLDTFGQKGQPGFTSARRNRLIRPAFNWLPFGAVAETGSSVFHPSKYSFRVALVYELDAHGVAHARVRTFGRQIVNIPAVKPDAPFVPIQGTTATTGGNLVGNRSYYMALVGTNSENKLSAISSVVPIGVVSETDTNTITVPNIHWGEGTIGYVVYGGTDPNLLSAQPDGTGEYFRTGTPSSVTLTSLKAGTWGVPDGEFDRYLVRVKRELHGGVWGAGVAEVTATTIKVGVPEPGFTTNEWAGYDLVWAHARGLTDLPMASFRVASNNANTLTLEAGAPNPLALGMEVNDTVILRAKPTFGTDEDGSYLECPGWQNAFYPDGMPVGHEVNFLIRGIAGPGEGVVVRCKANTATKHYADFPVEFTSESRYIIEEPNWQMEIPSDTMNNSDPLANITMDVDTDNFRGQTLLVQVLTLDGGNTESIEASAPIREIYSPGQPPKVRTVTADATVSLDDWMILVDTTAAPVTITLLPGAQMEGLKLIVKLITNGSDDDPVGNDCTIVPATGETIDGFTEIVLTQKGQSA